MVLPRVQETEYDVTHHGDSWFIRTNDGAKTFRVVEAPVKDPSKPELEGMIAARPEGDDRKRHRVQGPSGDRGTRSRPDKNPHHAISRPARRITSSLRSRFIPPASARNAEYNTKLVRFNYTSLVTPNSVFDYDMETRARELKKQQEVLGGYDPSQYQSERIYATALRRRQSADFAGLQERTGQERQSPDAAVWLWRLRDQHGPGVRSDRLSLLDRGFVYAIAHIRGGADLGKPWHEDGRILKKKNTFTDFIACAEYLIAEKYTSPDRLAIMGGSAGGLLMGAVTNMRPDLFAVVVAMVPFVDALNTMLDASLPLDGRRIRRMGQSERAADITTTSSPTRPMRTSGRSTIPLC